MTDPYGQPPEGHGQQRGPGAQDYFTQRQQPSAGYGVTPQGYREPVPYGQPQGYGQPPPGWAPQGGGQIGKIRGTGVSILLFIVTFGLYGLYWYFVVHDEMKSHTGTGLGGGIALLIYLVFSPVSAFLVSDEVGKLYSRRGQQPPVTALTGLWVFPGAFLLVLPIVWFVQTNGALNDYWRSLGATG